jgi:histone H1/5
MANGRQTHGRRESRFVSTIGLAFDRSVAQSGPRDRYMYGWIGFAGLIRLYDVRECKYREVLSNYVKENLEEKMSDAAAAVAPSAGAAPADAKSPKKKAAATKKAAAGGAKKPRAAKAPSNHPKYSAMIQQALTTLKERGGSSRQAILKYILKNFQVGNDEAVVNKHLKAALKGGVKNKTLKQSKGTGASGSFRIGEKPVEKKAPKKKPAKKAAKPKKAKKPKAAGTPKKAKSPKKLTKKAKPSSAAAAKKPKAAAAKKPKTDKPKKAAAAKKPKTAKAAKPKTAKAAKPKAAKAAKPKKAAAAKKA